MSESAAEINSRSISIEAKWEIDPRSVPVLVNQVHVTTAAGSDTSGLQLTLGHVNPPFFAGEPSEADIEALGTVPVVPVGRFYLPIEVARAMNQTLSGIFAQLDRQSGESDV